MEYIKKNIFFMSVIAVSVIAGISFIFASTTTQKDILKISQGSVIISLAQVVSTSPQLPETFDTTYSLPTGGTTYTVRQGDDLQAVIDKANLGDVIVLEAGATFRVKIANFPFVLPNKTGSGWIYVISSELANLPEGQRVNPSDSSHMPKLIALDNSTGLPVLRTAFGAHNYRFAGIEFLSENVIGKTYNLILHGYGLKNESADSYWTLANATTLDELPNNIVYDRCYFHSTGDAYATRCGLMGDGKYIAVVDSYFENFKDTSDAQAINVWAGPGPYKIVNNYLEATGENFMAGGADPKIANVVPSDIEFVGNYCTKRDSWMPIEPTYAGKRWTIKNSFELKNAKRVLVNGNIFENVKQNDSGQSATGIVFTVRNQSGNSPWSQLADITFTNNIIRHIGTGMRITGEDDIHPSQQTQRVLIKNNLFEDVNSSYVGGTSGGGIILSTPSGGYPILDLAIKNNLIFHTNIGGMFLRVGNVTTVVQNFDFESNIATHADYGLFGTVVGTGTIALEKYVSSYSFKKNVLIERTIDRDYAYWLANFSKKYPADNYMPDGIDKVKFVDFANKNYRLAADSPYKNVGTDGNDPGPNFDILEAATANTADGGGSPSTPPDNPPPVVVSPSPDPSPIVSPETSPEIPTNPNPDTTCKDLTDMSKYIPTYTGLELTYDVSKLNNFSDFLIKKLNIAEIQFLDKLSLIHTDANGCYQPINMNSATQLSDKKVKIDSTNYPELDKKARIKFYNVSSKYKIKKDGADCPESQCKFISYDAINKILIVEVKDF